MPSYPSERKEALLRKVLPPQNLLVAEVAEVTRQKVCPGRRYRNRATLRNWAERILNRSWFRRHFDLPLLSATCPWP